VDEKQSAIEDRLEELVGKHDGMEARRLVDDDGTNLPLSRSPFAASPGSTGGQCPAGFGRRGFFVESCT